MRLKAVFHLEYSNLLLNNLKLNHFIIYKIDKQKDNIKFLSRDNLKVRDIICVSACSSVLPRRVDGHMFNVLILHACTKTTQ